VSLKRFDTTSGQFEQIRAPRSVPSGQYSFKNLGIDGEYRAVAEFQGETGLSAIESLNPGTNTRDIVIEGITTVEGGITSSDVTLSDTEPTPGSAVTVTVTATPESESAGFSFSHEFNQSVASISDITTKLAGSSVDPITEAASQNRVTVTLLRGDVTAGEPITIEYTITTAETDGNQ
jgi:hypothetical protein